MSSIMTLLWLISTMIAVNAALILPTGNEMTTAEYDTMIQSMFDMNQKVQDASAAPTQVLDDEIERADELYRGMAPFWPRREEEWDPPKPEKPGEKLTGVPFDLLRICATISNQMYSANKLADLSLISPKDESVLAKAITFDNHDTLKYVIPPFCVAVADKCLIMAWRGSSTTMDWVSDFSAAPVSSSRWNKVSSVVRAHSGYTSLVESELAACEGFLLKEISSRKIDKLLLTGHSLGGGMAQVAHLMLEGQLQTKGSPWNRLEKSLMVQSVSFAAPMTTLVTTPPDLVDNPTSNLLTKIAKNSCNLVYGPDVVPHGPGDIKYAVDTGRAMMPQAIARLSLPRHWVLEFLGIRRLTNDALERFRVSELGKTLLQYRHIGPVIYYPVDKSSPVALRDCQFLSNSLPTFRDNKMVKLPTADGRNHISIAEQLRLSHSFLLQSFSY